MIATITMSNYIFNTNTDVYSKLVYAAIKKYSNNEGKCFPSRNTLSQLCKISLSTLRKAINNLVDTNVLDKKYRYRENRSQTSNLYTLTPFMTSGNYYFKVRADIFELDLTEIETVVYMYLCSCTNQDNECYPSIRQIASACSISQTSVKTAIKQLIEKNLLLKVNQYREDGGKRNNLYKLVAEDIKKEESALSSEMDNEIDEAAAHEQYMEVEVNEDIVEIDMKTEELEIIKSEELFQDIYAEHDVYDHDEQDTHFETEGSKEKVEVGLGGDIFSLKLSKNSLMAYLYISTYSELNTGKFPSIAQIACNCKISKLKVKIAIMELKNLGLTKRFEQKEVLNPIVNTEPPPWAI